MDQKAAVGAIVDHRPTIILGSHYCMPELSDLERILVVSDGTFTYQLETFVREPIGVEILSNELTELSSSNAHLLELPEGSQAWNRRTLLRGKDTGTAYSYATSVINDGDLNPDFRAELRITQLGIGHLMAKYRMGTFRELLTYYIDRTPDYALYLPHFRESSFLSRTYRVIFREKPIMVITENMPRDLFAHSVPFRPRTSLVSGELKP